MERVVYTSHAKIRLRVRKIDESEVNRILKSPQKLYFDTATGALVAVYDPKAIGNARRIFGESIEYAGDVEECLKDSECALIVTEWDEFRKLKPQDFIENMKTPVVVDGRRIYDVELFSSKLKFTAVGLGGRGYDYKDA
jgi:UDP-N-acetyl-D-mannosaminuronate dehydrogenase